MKFIVTATLLVFLLNTTEKIFAQDIPLQSELDATERQFLKDSVGVGDSIITQIFTLRDQFFARAEQIHSTKNVTENIKSNNLKDLANEINKRIKKTMGEAAYQKYIQLISRRMKSRKNETKRQPLASGN